MSVERSLRCEDWERATLAEIADGGLAAVHIDEIARRLSVTKGSFYWHFAGRDELIEACLRRWCNRSLARLDELAALVAPGARLRELVELSLGEIEDARVEVALAGVVDDERVTPFVEAVVQRRLAMLEDVFRELAAPEPSNLALLAHATYLGYLHTVRVDPARRQRPTGAFLQAWLALFTR